MSGGCGAVARWPVMRAGGSGIRRNLTAAKRRMPDAAGARKPNGPLPGTPNAAGANVLECLGRITNAAIMR